MMLGNKIAELRKEKDMTQEALANAFGVSNQAVSKWEANQSCPDILLLPKIADFFDVSLDYLFGRKTNPMKMEATSINHRGRKTEQAESIDIYDVSWKDDGKLRAAIYIGRNLVQAQDCTEAREITFTYEGEALDVISCFSVTCDCVEGNVVAYGNVTCDCVEGDIDAGGDVICDSVEGDIDAGGSVTCDYVGGNLDVGGSVTCGDVEGNVSAGGSVTCDDVEGNISAGGSVTCDEINGNVSACGDIIYK